VSGLKFERRGEEDYYKVILHIGSSYVPVSDDIVKELKKQSALMGDRFLDFFLEKMGYSSYLKDQIQAELAKIGDTPKQVTTIRQAILDL
jgi:hypothetical protein